MRTLFCLMLVLFEVSSAISQSIPYERTVDWTIAGIRDTTTVNFTLLDVMENGFTNDGSVANDNVFNSLLNAHTEPIVVYFPAGTYLFNNPIILSGNVVLRGAGAPSTILKLDLGGSGHGIVAQGSLEMNDTSSIYPVLRNNTQLRVNNPLLFSPDDWVRLIQQDSDLVYSSWGINTVGQIVRINNILGDSLFLDSPIRMDYTSERQPFIRKMKPIRNVGIECLTILRMDNTSPQQSSNIFFENAVNCWVNGVESVNTTFAHIEAKSSSNISITNSYIHDSFEYGGGGRGYGVMLHFTSNECKIYNNIFKHLRHSMILQAGANGNVFAYNHSLEPFWTEAGIFPSDAAGDMVLHGNYPYANLFEQNDGQNMVIDNSHGANGPYNTFFRNRGSLFGLFFSDGTSPNQNLVGNEITNTNFPYSSINYTVQGSGHFIFGNNNKGSITPSGTTNIPDSSYCFYNRPEEIPPSFWSSIGIPNALGSGSIPATYHYIEGEYFASACGATSSVSLQETQQNTSPDFFPNPAENALHIPISVGEKMYISIATLDGSIVVHEKEVSQSIDISHLTPGTYFVALRTQDSSTSIRLRFVKI
jgi:hypothetical protein